MSNQVKSVPNFQCRIKSHPCDDALWLHKWLHSYGCNISSIAATNMTSAPHCNALQRTATDYNAMQHTATHWYFWLCNSVVLQHTDIATAPHCNALQHTATHLYFWLYICLQCQWYCSTLILQPHHTATHCNTLQHTATHCNTLQHADTSDSTYGCNITYQCEDMLLERIASGTVTATHFITRQHTATHCNTRIFLILYMAAISHISVNTCTWNALQVAQCCTNHPMCPTSRFGG